MTKTLPETEEGYRNFFLMILGDKPNFVTHPDTKWIDYNWTAAPQWAVELMPEAHYYMVNFMFDEGLGMQRVYRLTHHAHEVFKNVKDKLIADLGEKRAEHSGFASYEGDDVQATDAGMPADVVDRLAQLEKEIEKEDQERGRNLEAEAQDTAAYLRGKLPGSN